MQPNVELPNKRLSDNPTDPKSQFDLAVGFYNNGNLIESIQWFQKAADQGHVVAQYNLGAIYARGQDVNQDYAKAIKWLQKAADQGNAHAQHRIGYMYRNGQGVKQDYAEAIRWFQKAAAQGDAEAQRALTSVLR